MSYHILKSFESSLLCCSQTLFLLQPIVCVSRSGSVGSWLHMKTWSRSPTRGTDEQR